MLSNGKSNTEHSGQYTFQRQISPHPTLSITPSGASGASGATSPDMSLSFPLVIKFPLNNSVWMIMHTKLQCFTPFSVTLLPSVHILYTIGSILLLENLLRQLAIFQKNIRGNTPDTLVGPNATTQDYLSTKTLHIFTWWLLFFRLRIFSKFS